MPPNTSGVGAAQARTVGTGGAPTCKWSPTEPRILSLSERSLRNLACSQSRLSHVMSWLEKSELVRPIRRPTEKRSSLAQLTVKGAAGTCRSRAGPRGRSTSPGDGVARHRVGD